MALVFERVAGLDVGKATVTVCVRTTGPNGFGALGDPQDRFRAVYGPDRCPGRLGHMSGRPHL